MSFVYDAGTYAHPDGTRKVTNPLIADATTAVAVQSGAVASIVNPGHTNETTLAADIVAAGGMGPNGLIRIWHLWSTVNTAGTKTLRVYFGGVLFAVIPLTTTSITYQALTTITNRGSLSSQFSAGPTNWGFMIGGGTPIIAAINTALAQPVTYTAQLSVGTDTLKLEGHSIEVVYGA